MEKGGDSVKIQVLALLPSSCIPLLLSYSPTLVLHGRQSSSEVKFHHHPLSYCLSAPAPAPPHLFNPLPSSLLISMPGLYGVWALVDAVKAVGAGQTVSSLWPGGAVVRS
eukprot:763019-Hanusia_phi.AAC.2